MAIQEAGEPLGNGPPNGMPIAGCWQQGTQSDAALYVTEGLQRHGHAVHWAATGTDGLIQARKEEVALLIVDRMLPSLDGLSLVKLLRGEGSRAPVLMLTTMSDLDDRVEGLDAGAASVDD